MQPWTVDRGRSTLWMRCQWPGCCESGAEDCFSSLLWARLAGPGWRLLGGDALGLNASDVPNLEMQER